LASFALTAFALGSGCENTAPPPSCGPITSAYRFPNGSPDGHPDPGGAKAAGQARAGRITSASMIHSPADVRFPPHLGDYLLANDKIALYIESARPSDGYNPFGGEIAAIEPVGDDGLPRGISEYGEGFYTAGGMVVAPEVVSVLSDGSDGGPAIVRSQGVLKIVPFLEGYAFLLGDLTPLPAALDYILPPGSEQVTLRLSIQNINPMPVDLGGTQILGFLMNRSATFTPELGFADLTKDVSWIGWESTNGHAMMTRVAPGLRFANLATSQGAQLFFSSGATMDACQPVAFDYLQLITATPGIDAVREAVRRVDNAPAWRAVTGHVRDGAGAAIAGAFVHATLSDGTYLTRATTSADGSYTVHVPQQDVQLQVTARGLPTPTPTTVAATTGTSDLVFSSLGKISIVATDGAGKALPVRIQIYPAAPLPMIPASFGVDDAGEGRVHLAFAVDGKADLLLAEGTYRVAVSHGYEYELSDQMVNVTAGQTLTLTPVLRHSVDTTGALSADFHIHSYYSLDAPDPVEYKVRSAIAEGLELPVSSEHEYVVDFGPVVEQLGATDWAHGLSSEELSTSTYGHYGVVPKMPQMDQVNRGAVLWADVHPPEIFARVRKLEGDPALIINHPQSNDAYKGYFVDASFDATTATGDPTDWSDNFDAIEVFNDSDFESNRNDSVKNWFSLLNHGKVVFATGASDSHQITASQPIGYPRTFLFLGTDIPGNVTPEMVRDAVKKGTSVVSGGLYMTVSGPGGVGPGGTVASTTPGMIAFDVVVQAPSWFSAKTLEVFVDGVSMQTITLSPSVVPGPGRRYETTVDLMQDGARHYVVFHAASDADLAPVHPGRKPFAVSNPIFY
jgi:hypothetical protein